MIFYVFLLLGCLVEPSNGNHQLTVLPNNWECPRSFTDVTLITRKIEYAHIDSVSPESDINTNIFLICYPALLPITAKYSNISLAIKPTPRFRFSEATDANMNICGNCPFCGNNTEVEWRGVIVKWGGRRVEFGSTLRNGTMDVTDYVIENFSGNVGKFIQSLFNGTQDCANTINDGHFQNGEFIEDIDEVDFLAIINYDLFHSLKINDKIMKYCKAEKPAKDNITSIDVEERMKDCKRKSIQCNKEAGHRKCSMDENYCISNIDNDKSEYNQAKPTEPSKDGRSQRFGGLAEHPMEVPEEESLEEERKKMKLKGNVSSSSLGLGKKRRVKRQQRNNNDNAADGEEEDCSIWTFDIRDKWPACNKIISYIRDQGKCNSAWAVSAASALTDRSCIFINKKRPQFKAKSFNTNTNRFASARDAMECTGNIAKNCNERGNAADVWEYYALNATVNEYCKPYNSNSPHPDWSDRCNLRCDKPSKELGSLDLLGWGNGLDENDYAADGFTELDWIHIKRFAGILYAPTHFYVLYPNKTNERLMKKELEANGTIVAGMNIYDLDLFTLQNGVKNSIFKCDKTHTPPTNYIFVRIIGYGLIECLGLNVIQKFWLAANSKGTVWGDDGFFKIARGSNECGIESDVNWGTLTAFPYQT